VSTPSGWQSPKTNWQSADVPLPADLNRIEGNEYAIEQGTRTVDPGQAPSSNTGTLRQLLNWLPNRIKTIVGSTNWWDAPATTLAGAKAHADAAAPHSGHETPAGAQAKVNTHAAVKQTHGAALHPDGAHTGDGSGHRHRQRFLDQLGVRGAPVCVRVTAGRG